MSPKLAEIDQTLLKNVVGHALSGKGAHVASAQVFSGLDKKTVGERLPGLPHSLAQILGHIVFWQAWVIDWLDGKKPRVPKHAAASWPEEVAPRGAADWKREVRKFQDGLKELERRARQVDLLKKIGKVSPLEMLQAIASHNSYHLGEAVVMRQMLGKWPPPSGGLTW
jgi:uncharacterized damage-inducible protein DinB